MVCVLITPSFSQPTKYTFHVLQNSFSLSFKFKKAFIVNSRLWSAGWQRCWNVSTCDLNKCLKAIFIKSIYWWYHLLKLKIMVFIVRVYIDWLEEASPLEVAPWKPVKWIMGRTLDQSFWYIANIYW